MAIKKKGNTGFLNGTTVEKFDFQETKAAPEQSVADTKPQTPTATEPQSVAEPQKAAVTQNVVEPQSMAAQQNVTTSQNVAAQQNEQKGMKQFTLEDVVMDEALIKEVAQKILQKKLVRDLNNGVHFKQGRPRRELIKGVKETSVNLQLPETIIETLRKKSKDENKTIKELIGYAIMNTYPECRANEE